VPDSSDPPPLDPGYEELNSFYKPGLIAGPHTIKVSQNIAAPAGSTGPDHSLVLSSTQKFNVVAPRYSLPSGEIHSIYPPQGHADHLDILPHVVVTDPLLPWERIGSPSENSHPSPPDEEQRNRVPWLALLTFTQDEVRLPTAQLAGDGRTFPSDQVQSTTMAINMTINDLWNAKAGTVVTPISQNDIDKPDGTTKADFVFVPSALFTSHVSTCDPKTGLPVPGQIKPDVDRYKYLSHVRRINTAGMAVAGVEDNGIFGVIVSHRVGPLGITQPQTVVCHLVSIEGVEEFLTLPISAQYVGLCSLYSWSYQCLPSDSVNFYDGLRSIGRGADVLRVSPSTYQPLITSADSTKQRVGQRLRDGFTMSRYRVQTAETTAAIWHGPFVPTTVAYPLAEKSIWTSQSNFSTDLQILDKEIGILDITYSTAWQLGKTLAIQDQSFASAYSRLRSTIHDMAWQSAKAEVLGNRHITTLDVLPRLADNVRLLETLHTITSEGPTPLNRWHRKSDMPREDLSFWSPPIRETFPKQALKTAQRLAASDGDANGGSPLYNELNRPNSPDWALVLKWVLDKLFFIDIPAHYLVTDPGNLPVESLRFFAIDRNWTDAFLDGALSIANHLEQTEDTVREAIKTQIQTYLGTTDPVLGYKPPVPTYGFFLRSQIVTQFPDLIVTAPREKGNLEPPILRQVNLSTDVMLVLFDRMPSSPDFATLTFTQPPHQQCFSASVDVNPNSFKTSYKKIYTTTDQPSGGKRKEPLGECIWTKGGTLPTDHFPVFDWDTRLLIFPNFAQDVLDFLNKNSAPGAFADDTATSALMGIQLNDPMYQMEIDLPTSLSADLKAVSTTSSSGPLPRPKPIVSQLAQRTLVLSQLHTPRLPPKRISPGMRSHKLPSFQYVTRTTRKMLPPPHHKTLRAPTFHPVITAIGGPPPQFTLSCYPVASASSSIPTQAGYGIDLVFAVNNTGSLSNLQLQEIFLEIPLGVTDPHSDNPPLTVNYTGSGGVMLSNLRWNVRVQLGDKALYVRLLPRSTKGSIPVGQNLEMGFILNQVDVNPYNNPTQVAVDVQERYTNPPSVAESSLLLFLDPSVDL
jgi:hypothetical protein